jgi:hypothetical protein
MQDELKTLLADTADLPVPRLQLVWEDRGEEGGSFLSVCHYLLVFPVGLYDIRNFSEAEGTGYTAVRMGETNCRGGSRRESLETPYRDGAHARWDSALFGFPVYVSRGREWQRVEMRAE